MPPKNCQASLNRWLKGFCNTSSYDGEISKQSNHTNFGTPCRMIFSPRRDDPVKSKVHLLSCDSAPLRTFERRSSQSRESKGGESWKCPEEKSFFDFKVTMPGYRIAQRKWRETRQQPEITSHQINCCLVFIHLLHNIMRTSMAEQSENESTASGHSCVHARKSFFLLNCSRLQAKISAES